MKWVYDEASDSATAWLVDQPAVDHSDVADIDFENGAVVVHMDAANRVVGIELMGVGQVAAAGFVEKIRSST